ncbi:SDR family oxidoreductase [Bordetella sp. 15P40C-2]|uniref:SDR family oxidoreductase n=1 Tax=Bordetella sp. 15P40C-2 TaxID=2572246 RepID=UPI0013240203|nr:SDR family oxidoreductase [Bordetella sp. 15P40C-2]MVW70384.1 SDR family oxidoreductase [Bordetella sp. 15P40C-2]
MDLGIRGKNAFVMASSSGLGLACATALAKEGVNVWINARNTERLEAAAASIRQDCDVQVSTIAADITTESGRECVLNALPAVDILVTNNEGPTPGTLDQWEHDAWIGAFEKNMIPHALFIRHYVGGMCERKFGRIVNITSAMVKSPRVHQSLSSAARTALTAFCKGLSAEVARHNVTINNLLPERIDTPRQQAMTQRIMRLESIDYDEARRRIVDSLAAKRMGTPEEFASACAYLCSAQAGFISGQNLQIDGGSYHGLV